MEQLYDLVIVGAGCVGIAAAFYARQKGWNVCIIESQTIGSQTRYWSSSFSARQNRVQYNEEYLTKYVVESNKEWKRVEDHFNQIDGTTQTFLHKQGALWFGDKNVSTSEGNIKAANAVITTINSTAQNKQGRLESLYMEKLMEGTPTFMKAFKPVNSQGSSESEWDSWSALYQPDGGSVNMQASYNRFLRDAKQNGVIIQDNTHITTYQFSKIDNIHTFNVVLPNKAAGKISGNKILLTAGVFTPYFLKNVMKEPYLADNQSEEFSLQEYVASYFKIDNEQGVKLYESMPNFYNFIDESKTLEQKDKQYSGYGFPFHSWDNLDQSTSHFVKVGTMANKPFKSQEDLNHATFGPITGPDNRIEAAKAFARHRMNHLLPDDPANKHYPCPIIFYFGRQTLLDYLNRTNESIVVQSGGWIGKYYPLLAKTAIMMLENPAQVQRIRSDDSNLYGNFVNRTRFPITSRVRNILSHQLSQGKTHFKTTVIGAGCSGLYAAYRLNRQKREHPDKQREIGNIGVFDLSDRISGRLKSFKFVGTTTPMELGGMRYIPTNHVLVNKIITDLGIPHLNFDMNGDPIQNWVRTAYLRNDYYRMNEWDTTQASKSSLHTAYRIEGPIMGMSAFQIISLSFYMMLTAPENRNLLTEVFLQKTDQEILEEKERLAILGQNVHAESSYYRDWKNYIYRDSENKRTYNIGLNLRQWNQLKPILLFRFRYPITDSDIYLGQEKVDIKNTYPLYKFGFQNVIEAQFGHEAYQFVAEQNGYFSNTSNASYLDQVMTYLLDFGNVSYRTLASGFDQINYAMANVLLESDGLSRANEGIFLNHKLVDILPGYAYGAKYELVFHVAVKEPAKIFAFKAKLNQAKRKFFPNAKHRLGRLATIEGVVDYAQIRFTTDRIILGMPRKSITLLANEIQLLRNPIEIDYKEIYNNIKSVFYAIFQYKKVDQYVKKGQQTAPLNPAQQARLALLTKKQEESFKPNSNVSLSQAQQDQLNTLSYTKFVKSIQPLSAADSAFEHLKEPKFEHDVPLVPKDLTQLAQTTQLMPAMKIVMNFDRSWWNPEIAINAQYQKKYKNTNLVSSVEEMRGVSLTDLPARQTLYFSSGSDNLLLASYNDMITTEFWTALHENFTEVWQPANKNDRRHRINVSNYPPSMDIHPAKRVLVSEILKQLSLVHQLNVEESWVKECIYQFWGRDPYGAGYHNFFSGYYIPAVMKAMRKPWSQETIHFVGEAYSNETGWVEGAFQTTELLLQEQLNVSEFVPNYYAGY